MANVRSIRSAAQPPGRSVVPFPQPIPPGGGGVYRATPPSETQSPYGNGPFLPGNNLADPRTLIDQVAPWVQIDRYPIIAGSNLTLERVSSVFRLALTGYRQLYVDILDELIEKDPSAYGVCAKRALAVANGKVSVAPAILPDDATEALKNRAKEIASFQEHALLAIPKLRQHLASLAWAFYYGLQGAEILWDTNPNGQWVPRELVMIHSRRLSYPDPWRWDLYVWDQGAVIGSPYGTIQLPPGIFGWRISDYPGKFIVHAPQVRGDYPTREGVGRQIAYWLALKHIAARGAPVYLDRFAYPWLDINWTTADEDGKHRKATAKDIEQANQMALAGAFKGVGHPDSIKIETKSPDGVGKPKITYEAWINICNSEVTKAVLGGGLGTDVGSTGGNRALGETQRKDTLAFFQYDASALAQAFDEGLLVPLAHLNYPGEEHLSGRMMILVEDDPDPDDLAKRAVTLASGGYPVDVDALEEKVGIAAADPDDLTARVMRPIKPVGPMEQPVAPAYASNPTKTPEEYEAEKQAAMEQQAELHRSQLEDAQDNADEAEASAEEERAKNANAPKPNPTTKSKKKEKKP